MKFLFEKRFWFQKLPEEERLSLYSCMFLVPGIVVVIGSWVTNKMWSIPLVYGGLEPLIFWSSWRYVKQRTARKEEEQRLEENGEGMVILRRKLQELRDIEKNI